MLAVMVAAGALLGTSVMAGTAGAGQGEPTAEAVTTCVEGEGFINVGITDDSSEV
jgi:hypothetical protein